MRVRRVFKFPLSYKATEGLQELRPVTHRAELYSTVQHVVKNDDAIARAGTLL